MNPLTFGCLVLSVASAAAQNAQFAPLPTMPLSGTMAFDPQRNVVLVVETGGGRLWEWDGSRFDLLTGATHAAGSAAVFDPDARLLTTTSGETWNGASWITEAVPTGWGLGNGAYDVARRRLVRLSGTAVAERSGGQWVRVTPPATPGLGGALVYDPTRSACVLAIGSPPTLWSWTGSQWNLVDGSFPGGNSFGSYSVAHDPANARLVLLGGPANGPRTTWTFGNGGWTQIATPADIGPGTRPLAFDGTGVLALGGVEGIHRLEGSVWRRLSPGLPRARFGFTLASTPARAGVVLFGGGASVNDFRDETWVFDRVWTRPQPQNPPPRQDAALAWSPVDQGFVLFGGRGPGNVELTDTWIWTGTDWQARSPVNAPNVRTVLVTDPAGGVLALPAITATNALQWRWNGADWLASPTFAGAINGYEVMAAFEPRRNVAVAVMSNRLVEWNGTTWRLGATDSNLQLATAVFDRPDVQRIGVLIGLFSMEWDGVALSPATFDPPSGTGDAHLVTDYGRGRVLSVRHPTRNSTPFNGVDATMTPTPANVDHQGYGCALGPSPGLATEGRPVPAEPAFAITARTFAASAPCLLVVGFGWQPSHLGAGCVAFVAPPAAPSLLVTDGVGHARMPLPIPGDPALRGTTVLAQIGVLDPARSPLGSVTVSDALRIVVGD